MEVGLEHGQRAGDLIEANLKLYFHRFQDEWGVPREEVLRRARKYEAVIWEEEADYGEAMRGVAEGSGLPLDEIVALNVRYEIVYSEYTKLGMERRGLPPPSGCTSIGLLPQRTEEGRLLMAQNWDWIPGVKGLVVQFRIRDGPEVLAFTEAGIVGGKIGLNSHRLGLLINGLVSNEDRWDRLGMPFHVRCWRVLQSETLEEAARHIRENPGSCSANFLLGRVHGGTAELLDLESSPVGVGDLHPEGGVLTHTNHFHRPEDLGIWQPLIEDKTSTFERQSRADEILKSALREGGRVAFEDVRSLLRDHRGRPKSVCRHKEDLVELPPVQRYETVASVIVDVGGGTLQVAEGRPCETAYELFALETQ
jgi:isopenicillin-N N-acyltransferase-like protein